MTIDYQLENEPIVLDPIWFDTRKKVDVYKKSYFIEDRGNITHKVNVNDTQLISEVTSKRGRKQLKDPYGWLPPNKFSLTRNSGKIEGGSLSMKRVRDDYLVLFDGRYSECFWTDIAPSYYSAFEEPINLIRRYQGEAEAVVYQANAEAYERLNKPDFAGWALIFEAKESIIWLRSLAAKALQLTSNFNHQLGELRKKERRKNKKDVGFSDDFESFVNEGSAIGSLWMQYRYAIMPLILQVRDFQELLNRNVEELRSYTGYVEMNRQIDKKIVPTSNPAYVSGTVTTTTTLECRGAVKLYPRFIKSVGDTGLSPYDVLLGGYEITKLSWVLDWFLDVGTWLAAWRPTNAIVQYQSNTSVVNLKIVKEIVVKAVHDVGTDKTDLRYATPQKITSTMSWVERDTRKFKNLLPALTQEALLVQRQLDALALTFQALGKLVQIRNRSW